MRGFETDIRMCSDGTLIIMHDSHVSRVMVGEGLIEEHPWSYFKGMLSKKHGNPISCLDDLLEFFNAHPGLYVEFEMKVDKKAYPDDVIPVYCEKVYEAVYAHKPAESVYVLSSFDQRTIRYLMEHHPERSDLYMAIYGQSIFQDLIDDAKALGVKRVAAMIQGTSAAKVKELRAAGVDWINLWPVQTPEEGLLAYSLGADILCLDAPVTFFTWLSANAPWMPVY